MPESTSRLPITSYAQSCTTCTTLCRSVSKGRLTSHDYRISTQSVDYDKHATRSPSPKKP